MKDFAVDLRRFTLNTRVYLLLKHVRTWLSPLRWEKFYNEKVLNFSAAGVFSAKFMDFLL